MSYKLVSYDLDEGFQMLVLGSVDQDGEASTFIGDLQSSGKTIDRASLISKSAKRIAMGGIEWAIVSRKLRKIDSDLALFEMKINKSVIRVMTYIHEEETPVYLFDFDGHQGKTGKIPQSYIDKGREMAIHAAECMRSEEGER